MSEQPITISDDQLEQVTGRIGSPVPVPAQSRVLNVLAGAFPGILNAPMTARYSTGL